MNKGMRSKEIISPTTVLDEIENNIVDKYIN